MNIASPTAVSTVPTAEVLCAVEGQLGVITLNRPQALNALTLGMVRQINAQLIAWEKDAAVQAVLICGEGNRAFCAGGDVKAVALATRAADPQEAALARDFFYEEYQLNHRIFTYAKPYIALVDGIVMGGGVGVSVHGAFRVVSENIMLAMPETLIGFFPDVGGGYFLPRCPGRTGEYLGLTGQRVGTADAMYAGYATHYVPLVQHAELRAALAAADLKDATDPRAAIEEILARFIDAVPGDSHLAPLRTKIDRCFGHNQIEGIIAALGQDGSNWAGETLEKLYAVSPTSLKVTLEHLRRSAGLDFARVMTMEYRLSQAFIRSPDTFEGIRAALIDKDRAPKWRPARINDVGAALVESYFAARPGDEWRP